MDPTTLPSFGDYLREWLDLQRSQLQPSTWESYRSNVDRYLLPALGNVLLDAVSAPQLSAFYARLNHSGGRAGQQLSLRETHAGWRNAWNLVLSAPNGNYIHPDRITHACVRCHLEAFDASKSGRDGRAGTVGFGVGGRGCAATRRGGVVREDAGGLGPPAVGAAVERFDDR